jgi:hypothetical protein
MVIYIGRKEFITRGKLYFIILYLTFLIDHQRARHAEAIFTISGNSKIAHHWTGNLTL